MNVDLPSDGCNIINSATSFYNYSTDGRTRDSYVIYEGKIFKQSSSYNQYGYTYTGDCVSTGDLIYKPELQFWYQIVSGLAVVLIFLLISNVFLRKFWRVLR